MIASSTNLQQALEAHERGDLQQAASIYRQIISDDPANADAQHLLGVSALQQRDFETAAESIGSALAIDDGVPLYHSNFGAALRELGRLGEAVGAFQRSVELDPQFAGGHLNLGLALERQGQIDAAIASLQKAVAADRRYADAFLSLGRLLTSSGRAAEAVEFLERGIASAPQSAALHYNLGNALSVIDRTEEAADAFRGAIRQDPDVAEFHNNLGAALQKLERWDEATECFQRAVDRDPANDDARYNLAVSHERQGQSDDSLAELRRGVELHADNVDALVTLAKCLERRGRFEESLPYLESAIDLAPERADILFALGFNALSRGEPDAAQHFYERGLEIDPDDTASWNALGTVFVGREQQDEAEDCFRSALTIDPEDAIACYNLGNVYKDQWRLEDAIDHYDRAVELDPDFAEAHINRGVVLKHAGRLSEAVESQDRALEARPGDAEARFHRAVTLLMQGDFERGWDEYEARWDYDGNPRHFAQPVWIGSSLRDRSLLVYSEQGIGDEILFASCLPDVLGQTANCVIECDPRLVPLFARSFPMAVVVANPVDFSSVNSEIPECDTQIALGSLPRHTRRKATDFPPRRRFLAADPSLLRRWRTRLKGLGEGLRIGISWRGGKTPAMTHRRSATLDQWQPLFELPDVHFVNLQYGEVRAEIREARKQLGITIHNWDDVNPLKDLDGFAAQIAALDLVISIDNSTVHMAGALGVPVWTLLAFAPDWRWMLERDDSPWYPSMRLFRQDEPECWEPLFQKVSEELNGLRNGQPSLDTATHEAFDEDADAERRKYEHIWTHDSYRAMSPGLLDADKVELIAELRKRECRTILDAGCGSGKLMQKLLTEHADEFSVRGFDISDNCLDPFFDDVKEEILTVGCLWNSDDLKGEYDSVICTDVMEHIPTDRVSDVLANLQRCTRKFAYLAIALFPDGFGPKLLGEPLHLTVESPNWWFEKMGAAGFRIEGHAVERTADGQDMWLHAFLGV